MAAALIALELALGAVGFGGAKLADPCTSKPAFAGGGVDGAVQRIALSGLNGAACRLGTSREELVLSFSPGSGEKIRWTRPTIDAALRAGIDRAATDTAGGGVMGSVARVPAPGARRPNRSTGSSARANCAARAELRPRPGGLVATR